MKTKKLICISAFALAFALTGCTEPNSEMAMPNETENPNPISLQQKSPPKNKDVIHEVTNPSSSNGYEILNPEIDMGAMIQGNEIENCLPNYPLTDYDRDYLVGIVLSESGNQCLEGKMAVAQCLFDAMKKEDMSPQEVKKVYKYSGWNEDFENQYEKYRNENPEAYAEAKEAVHRVFDNGEKVTDEYILYFHNPDNGYSKFHEEQKFVIQIQDHKFYTEWD